MAVARNPRSRRRASVGPADDGDVALWSADALRIGLGERLVAVVLFGSRARGDASSESDWDLLVIAEDLPARRFERHLYLKGMLPDDIRGQVAILAKTPNELETHLPSIYLDVALDGRILHDPRGYAAERLAVLRGIIERAGLYREITTAGMVWEWRRPPRGAWSLEWTD